MTRPRYTKIRRDMRQARGRILLMTTAVAVSLIAIGAMLTARTVVTREASANYTATRPASATLDIAGGITPDLLTQVRTRPGITDATARQTLTARVRTGDTWHKMLLFVIDADDPLRISRFDIERGTWPPPADGILLERSAQALLDNPTAVTVTAPGGQPATFTVTGAVHDAAAQERTAYGYLTPQGLTRLGPTPTHHQLKTSIAGDQHTVDTRARELATWLTSQGHTVNAITAPPAGRHPHQSQIDSVTLLFLGFAAAALLLAAAVVATTLGGMLAQQTRQIGILKTLGATTTQILGTYLLLTLAVATAALLLAAAPAILAGLALADATAGLLNLDITDTSIPTWVLAALAATGLGTPLLVALAPLTRAARTTVRAALDHRGTTPPATTRAVRPARGNRLVSLALRNALRRRGRLALTLALLTAGGALFTGGLSTANAWNTWVDDGLARRHYDAEITLTRPAPAHRLTELLRGVPGLTAAEPLSSAPAVPVRGGQVEPARTYPDGGHGAFNLVALPPQSRLTDFELLRGRHLRDGEPGTAVLNQTAATRLGDPAPGTHVTLRAAGTDTTLRVVGVVAEVGGPATAYTAHEPQATATAVRLAYDDPAALTRAEQRLADAGIAAATVVPTAELRTAVDEHVLILIQTLVALAALMAVVGTLGLASAMGIAVTERTREFGIMQTLGATPRTVRLTLILEGTAIGLAGSLLAVAAGLPAAALVGDMLGTLSFGLPLPLAPSRGGMAAWAALGVAAAAAATLTAARRAGRLTVKDTLTYE
ncbi:ABC-type transport system, involved in lipoprotein release, permease component [Sinosporangium album]|uniref:ABC-type transport system, involved in lipoprotein release, permease component n=1 Tax=Sinosporangium album TaxID=504805 RepID=A0A1G8DLD3_9ACTN|nr:FtsX-like permease family protein [Sinosporangium album]SDH58486.1 ABC-type transport system, involved in lipoprotein release, permease component [Sinosporangium album]